ncbi:MAG: DUF1318 domain-containing protein [Opitutales bacterium]|jgi:uncharacterized protein|tara:strand:+ start:3063 stop:3428 length:366 start_codon:yes stop_codon:yes gene_type:complete
MNFKNFINLFFISSLAFSPVFADSNLTSRMKDRLPLVLVAKDAGSIGEGLNGMLLVRKDASSEVEELVKAENKDRGTLFKILAKKTGGDSKDVAKKFAKAIASKAKKGHWFKNSSGNWVSK